MTRAVHGMRTLYSQSLVMATAKQPKARVLTNGAIGCKRQAITPGDGAHSAGQGYCVSRRPAASGTRRRPLQLLCANAVRKDESVGMIQIITVAIEFAGAEATA